MRLNHTRATLRPVEWNPHPTDIILCGYGSGREEALEELTSIIKDRSDNQEDNLIYGPTVDKKMTMKDVL